MITGNELVQALDQNRAIQEMLEDPDLNDNLLLIAIAFRAVVIGHHFTRRSTWLDAVCEATGLRLYTVQHHIGRDVPRYQAPTPGYDVSCDAPMIRRDGPCGQRASHHLYDIDPATGEQWGIHRCGRHFDRSLWLARDVHWREWTTNGKPSPPHNTGGILRRHFPNVIWEEIYAWAAPHVEQTPGEGKPPTPRPPKLTLIRCGAE